MKAEYGIHRVDSPLRPFIAHQGSDTYRLIEHAIRKWKKSRAGRLLKGVTAFMITPIDLLSRSLTNDFHYYDPEINGEIEAEVPCFHVIISTVTGESDDAHTEPEFRLTLWHDGEQEFYDDKGRHYTYEDEEIGFMNCLVKCILSGLLETMEGGVPCPK